MQFKVLGTLEVLDTDGRPIDVGGSQPRAVLAMLLMAADRVVPADTIIDRLWPDGPPASASGTLQSYMSRLRRALDPRADGCSERTLTWEARGYRLHPDPGDAVDFIRFEELAERGRELLLGGDATKGREVLIEALALWRGPAFVEFCDHGWARGVCTGLDERRLAALEDRVRADLQLGRHELVVGELNGLIDQHPLREGLWELLAIALYRSGRQAEALRALDDLRRQLVEGLGIDPSQRIRDLETQILGHDPSLRGPTAAPPDPPQAIGDPFARASRHLEGLTASELIGREDEKLALHGVIEGALRGATQWVILEGEAGIGKTRLLEHIAHEASERGFMVLWGRCYESGAPPACWLWLAILRALTDAGDRLPPATQELIDRLLSPSDDDSIGSRVDPGRFRLFEAVSALLQQASRREPLLLALDDLQWADPASLELIEFITGNMPGARVIVAATVRELEIGRNDALVQALAHISRRPLSKRLQLRGLDRNESSELARVAIGTELSPDVIDAIHQRSEGNPFFIGELSRLLASESGLTQAELVRRAAVPAGVRDVVHRRLVQLPPKTLELIQVAATIGREPQLGLLSRTAGVPLEQCIDELEPAFVNHVIVEVPDSPGTIRFAHGLVREVVLDDMSMLRRSRLHLRAADAIEASARHHDDIAEIVAEHLWNAVSLGGEERAAAALERAAEVALRRFSYETADTLLERSLQLRRDLPPDRADLDAELDAMNRLIQVRRVRHGFERARLDSPIARAKELARATKRDGVLTMLLWTEWAGACTSCDFQMATTLALELRKLAATSKEPLVRSTGFGAWGILCWHLGRISEGAESLDQAMAELDAAVEDADARTAAAVIENIALSRGFHTFVRELAGKPLPGGSPLPAAAERESDPYVRLVLWVFEALRAVALADVAAGERAVSMARSIEVGDSFEFFRAGSICLEGCVEVMLGNAERGIELLERGSSLYSPNGVRTILPLYLSFGARAHLDLGNLDAAEEWMSRANALLEETGEVWQRPFLLCSTARIARAREEADAETVTALVREAYNTALAQGSFGVAVRVKDAANDLCVSVD